MLLFFLLFTQLSSFVFGNLDKNKPAFDSFLIQTQDIKSSQILNEKTETMPEIRAFFFYSPDCEGCHTTMEKVLPLLKQKYNLYIKDFNIDESDHYELLLKFEEKYNDTDNKIPCIIIGEYIFGGNEEIEEKLEKAIQEYEQEGCNFPNIKTTKNTTDSLHIKKIYFAYFYSDGCRECDRITYELKYLENKYSNIKIEKFDISTPENKTLNEALCELYKIPEKKRLVTPMIFVGEKFLIEKEIKSKHLINLIEKYQTTGTKIPWEEAKTLQKKSEKNIKTRFNKMSIFVIFFAGLTDGVNPCAFATILFFVAFLSFIGKKGKEVLIVGASFTITVFIVYFLIGIGIFSFIKTFTFMPIVRKLLFSIMGIFAIVLGGLSIYDYFKIRSGKYKEVKLQLPNFLKKRIHTDIREKMKMRNYILASITIGFLVSLSEFVCTGQVYLPTIIFITTQIPSLKIKGLSYLFLYNLAFILPLVIVFGVVYKGTTTQELNLFWEKHGAISKLAISILFFLLGGLLIFYAYH